MNEVIFSQIFPAGYYCEAEHKELFIRRLRNDMKKAVRIWDEKHRPEAIVRAAEDFIKGYNSAREYALKIAQTKWKTEKKQQAYVNAQVAKYAEQRAQHISTGCRYTGITFFDIDLNPGVNGISGDCVLNVNASDVELERCWEKIKNNEYFKVATGWRFEYDGCGRPQIKLILPKKMQQKYDEAKESLARAISKFYEGCTYFED